MAVNLETQLRVYARDHHTCIYCGFDGRPFDSWMQLTIDHVLPQHQGGPDDDENLAVACQSCNSITCRMSFDERTPRDGIVAQKRARVAERRKAFMDDWKARVLPTYLERPVGP